MNYRWKENRPLQKEEPNEEPKEEQKEEQKAGQKALFPLQLNYI